MLEGDARKRAALVLTKRLREATIVYIGRADVADRFFSRKLHLKKDAEGRSLKPMRLPAPPEKARKRPEAAKAG